MVLARPPHIGAVHLACRRYPRLSRGRPGPDKTSDPWWSGRDPGFTAIINADLDSLSRLLCKGKGDPDLSTAPFKTERLHLAVRLCRLYGIDLEGLIEIEDKPFGGMNDPRVGSQRSLDRLFGRVDRQRQIVKRDVICRLFRHQGPARIRGAHSQLSLRIYTCRHYEDQHGAARPD